MPGFPSILDQAISGSIETLQLLKQIEAQVAKASDLIEQCLRAGNKLLIRGNGGSASDKNSRKLLCPVIPIFSGDARVRDLVAGVRSRSNFQCRIWRFCRESDQSKHRHHLARRHGARASSAEREF